MKRYNEKKIFVTGISGSGKTVFALKYAKDFTVPYFPFDLNWNYRSPSIEDEYNNLVKKYPDKFITDAIPYLIKDGQLAFLKYYEKNRNNIKIICVCCTNIDELNKRLLRKYFTNIKEAYDAYHDFYFNTLKNNFSGLNIEYFDSCNNEFIDENTLYERISWFPEFLDNYTKKFNGLKDYINEQKYDKFYQDVESVNLTGYTKSYITWNNIKDLVDWKNKRVADLGCFHCYFSFKVAKMGADVTGFDISEDVLRTSKYINEIEGNPIELKKWCGGEEVSSEYDVVLCLNVLHHFSNIKEGLKNIKAKTVIFETNVDLIDKIIDEFDVKRVLKSNRVDANGIPRIILLCEKLRYEK
jgi:hypothetical protein